MIFCPLDPDARICIFFADPDPESQNVADPTNPDPKHCPDDRIFSKIIEFRKTDDTSRRKIIEFLGLKVSKKGKKLAN